MAAGAEGLGAALSVPLEPLLACALVDGSAPRLPAAACWAALPPEALSAAGLAAGQAALLGISPHRAPAGQGGARAAGQSAFGPSQDLMGLVSRDGPPLLEDLWALCASRAGLPGTALGGPGPQDLGARLVAARVWPASKLARGSLLLSPCLRETVGQPASGTIVLVYRLPAGSAPQPASRLTLRLCADALLQAPVEPVALLAATATATATAAAASSGTPSKLATRATDGASAATAAADSPGPSTPAAAAKGGSSASKRAAGGPGQQQAGAAGAAAGSSWALRALSGALTSGDNATRSTLQALAGRHLAGRLLLPGTPIVLPVLGVNVLCRVCPGSSSNGSSTGGSWWQQLADGEARAHGGASTSPAATNAAAAAATAGATPGSKAAASSSAVPVFDVSSSTAVAVLLPGDPDPDVDHPGQQQQGSSPLRAGSSPEEAVARAREAAAAAVADSAAGAAADAAERALRAGFASGGLDLSSLGGVDAHLRALRELVGLPLRAPHLFAQYRIRPPRGVLLYGPPGSGKTVLARAAAADAGATVFTINGPDVISEYFGESEAALRGIFAAAGALAPSVVFIDEIDALAPARESAGGFGGGGGGSSGVSSRLVTCLLTMLDGAEEGPAQQGRGAGAAARGRSGNGGSAPAGPVVVVAATNRPAALDSALRRPGRLERELEIGVPGPAARLDILRARLRGVCHVLSEEEVAGMAAAAHGFVSADLAALVDEAAMSALRRIVGARVAAGAGTGGAAGAGGGAAEEEAVTMDDFRAAETRVRPSALREVAVEVPRVGWADVGGLSQVKQALREAVEWPHKMKGAMARLGAQAPRGVLLYGPPGCSKTLLARAVAAEARLNFISVKGGELYSKYVGESEKAIASVFARARAVAPCIIFFDEIDGLAGSRSGMGGGGGGGGAGGGDVGERVISQMLTEMDGMQELVGVTVLAATNRPDCVDPALLRPGRFDRLLYVPPPDLEARAEVFAVQLRRCPLGGDVDVRALAAATAGYTGADIGALVREAALAALEEDMGAVQVAARHFDAALAAVPPSVPPSSELLGLYERMQRSIAVVA